MSKKVSVKWEVDGNLAVIYQVGNGLLFYNNSKDPNFKRGEEISLKRAEETKPYKALPFSTGNIPNDAYLSLTF
jgi:hypothetical protein